MTPFDTFANIGDMKEIEPNSVYTTEETRVFLKVSESTIKRLLKNGILRANKVGGQYRILGKEILYLVSPDLEKKASKSYLSIKKKFQHKIESW